MKKNSKKSSLKLGILLAFSIPIISLSSCSQYFFPSDIVTQDNPPLSYWNNFETYKTPLINNQKIFEYFRAFRTDVLQNFTKSLSHEEITYKEVDNTKTIKTEPIKNEFFKLNSESVKENKFRNNIVALDSLEEAFLYASGKPNLWETLEPEFDYINFNKYSILVISQIATKYKKKTDSSNYGYSLVDYKLTKNEISLKLELPKSDSDNQISFEKIDDNYTVLKTYFIITKKANLQNVDFDNLKISILN